MSRKTQNLCLASLCMIAAACAWAKDTEDSRKVTFEGYGPVRIGMTTRQLEGVLGKKLTYRHDFEDESCRYADLGGSLQGASAMLIDDRIARIDIDSETIKTLSGIGIGDSTAKILSAYKGRVTREPHAYTAPEGFYYTLHSSDGKLGIRFETDRNIVTMFYAGRSDAIQLIEGCQ